MARVIARVKLNPIYTSWQDKTNGIYLTAQTSEADILSDMSLDYIKNAINQNILDVIDGDIDLTLYENKFADHKKILLDNTWTKNQLIMDSTGNAITGIQLGEAEYEFKGGFVSVDSPSTNPTDPTKPAPSNPSVLDDYVIDPQKVWSSYKISSLSTLDSKPQYNLNYIRRFAIQDGLSNDAIDTQKDFTLLCAFTVLDITESEDIKLCGIYNDAIDYSFEVYWRSDKSVDFCYQTEEDKKIILTVKTKLSIGATYLCTIIKNENLLSATIADSTLEIEDINLKHCIALPLYVDDQKVTTSNILSYNRALTLEEVRQNLSVLNSPPSIAKLDVTSLDGTKTEYAWATDSAHVTMKDGYSLEQYFVNQMLENSEEYKTNNTPLSINNIQQNAELLELEINGQTINVINEYNQNLIITPEKDIVPIKKIQTLPRKNYTAVFKVASFTGTPRLGFRSDQGRADIPISEKGFQTKFFSTGSSSSISTQYLCLDGGKTIEGNSLILDYFYIAEGDINVSGFIPFGAHSTNAVLNVNNKKYPFFDNTKEKTIQIATLSNEESDTVLLSNMIAEEIEWFKGCILPNGAIAVNNYPKDRSFDTYVNPYFSSIGLINYLKSNVFFPELKQITRNYIAWYLDTLNTAETDTNGIDGTMFDWGYTVENEEIIETESKEHYDSIDSYSSCFLGVVYQYIKSFPGEISFIVDNFTNINRVARSLLEVFSDSGLTLSKPNYPIKYLMDNSEVFDNIVSAKELYAIFKTHLTDKTQIESATENYKRFALEANKFPLDFEDLLWNATDNYYYPAISGHNHVSWEFDWTEFYSSSISQLYPIFYGICGVETSRARYLYDTFSEHWDWQNFSQLASGDTNNYWIICGAVATMMGEYDDALHLIQKFKELYTTERKYPYLVNDSGFTVYTCKKILDRPMCAEKNIIALHQAYDISDSILQNINGDTLWIKRTHAVTLNGNESIEEYNRSADITFNDTIAFSINVDPAALSTTSSSKKLNILCPGFSPLNHYAVDSEGIFQDGVLLISILKSKLETQDVDGFRKWLKANNLYVIYQLAEPTTACLDKASVPYIPLTNSEAIISCGHPVNASYLRVILPLNKIKVLESVTSNFDNALEDLKYSVANGKQLLARAITDKGVATSVDDSFDKIAQNIEQLDISASDLPSVTLSYAFENNIPYNGAGILSLNIFNDAYRDVYSLYFTDSLLTPLKKYPEICTLDLTDSSYGFFKTTPSYAIPDLATHIIAVNSSSTVYSFPIPLEKLILPEKLYSVGLLSDIHISKEEDSGFSHEDFKTHFNFFKENGAIAACVCGDVTNRATIEEMDAYTALKQEVGIPVYACQGNHDLFSEDNKHLWQEHAEPNGEYYEKRIGDDVYLFVGLQKDSNSNPFSDEVISWLKIKLREHRQQRVFLFVHAFLDPVGNVNNLYPYAENGIYGDYYDTGWGFEALMKIYRNVIYFSGHSHLDPSLERLSDIANIQSRTRDICHRVHIPSASVPRGSEVEDPTKEDVHTMHDKGFSYLMDVYKDFIILRAYEVKEKSELLRHRYILNTSPIDVPFFHEDFTTFVQGSLSSDGEDRDSSSSFRSDFVEIIKDTESITMWIPPEAEYMRLACYDENKDFLDLTPTDLPSHLIGRNPRIVTVKLVPGTRFIKFKSYSRVVDVKITDIVI